VAWPAACSPQRRQPSHKIEEDGVRNEQQRYIKFYIRRERRKNEIQRQDEKEEEQKVSCCVVSPVVSEGEAG